MTRDTGGPAFPVGNGNTAGHGAGMTLRDWFAGQTLTGIIANEGVGNGDAMREIDAYLAYAQADAMIAARKES